MKATISKANRPRYFIANDICVRISNIIFVQKAGTGPLSPMPTASECSVVVGISTQQPPVFIPCKDAIEQTAIFTQLSTILSNL